MMYFTKAVNLQNTIYQIFILENCFSKIYFKFTNLKMFFSGILRY